LGFFDDPALKATAEEPAAELQAPGEGREPRWPRYSQRVHVADGPAGHDGVRHRLLELPGGRGGSGGDQADGRAGAGGRAEVNSPHGQVHGADGEEREGVDFDHDGHEGHVEEDFDEAWGEQAHQDLVLGQPWVGGGGMGPPRSPGPMFLDNHGLVKVGWDLQGHLVPCSWAPKGWVRRGGTPKVTWSLVLGQPWAG